MTGFSIFVLAVVALAVLTIAMGVKSVSQSYEWTIERFGRYHRILKPGLNFVVPHIDQVGKKVDMIESVLDIDSQEVIIKDNAMARADGVICYQVLDAAKAAYEVSDLTRAIQNLTMIQYTYRNGEHESR